MIYTTIWPGVCGRARLVDERFPEFGWVLETINDHPDQAPSKYRSAHAKGETLEAAWEQLCYIVDLDNFLT